MDRRSFFKIGGVVAASGLVGSCGQAAQKVIPYVIPPDEGINPVEGWFFATTCKTCEEGCGLLVRTVEGRAKKIEGNPSHPVNKGGVCARGQASVFHIYHPERLQQPMKRTGAKGTNEFTPITWEEAIGELSKAIPKGKGGNAFALGSSASDMTAAITMRLLNKLGSNEYAVPSLNGNETYLESSKNYAATPGMPYYDISQAKFVFLLGADIFETGFSHVHYGHAFGDMRRGDPSRRGATVYAGPRMSITAASCDHFIGTRPGELGFLAMGVAHVVLDEAITERLLPSIPGPTLARWSKALEEYTPEHVEGLTGVEAREIHHLAQNFLKYQPAMAVPGDEVASHSNGLEALRGVEFLNLLSRELGREMHKLPPHNLPKADSGLCGRMRAFIGAPADAKHHAKLAGIAKKMHAGKMKLGIINGIDPVHYAPGSLKLAEALSKVETVVVTGCFLNNTTQYADLVLPDLHFLEAWSAQVNEYPQNVPAFSLQQPVVNPMYDVMAAGDALLSAALKSGNDLGSADTQSLIKEMISKFRAEWPEISPTYNDKQAWETLLQRGGWWPEVMENEMHAEPSTNQLWDAANDVKIEKPKFTGAAKDGFHLIPYHTVTMGDGRTSNIPALQEMPEPMTTLMWSHWVEINIKTAEEMGIKEGDLLKIESDAGSIEAPAYPFPGIAPDVIAIPFGYGHQSYGKYATGRGANAMALLGGGEVEGSGALAWRGIRVTVTKTGKTKKILRDADPRGEYVGEVFGV